MSGLNTLDFKVRPGLRFDLRILIPGNKVRADLKTGGSKVQLAEFYIAKNKLDQARGELKDVLTDDIHAPAFQRRRDRI